MRGSQRFETLNLGRGLFEPHSTIFYFFSGKAATAGVVAEKFIRPNGGAMAQWPPPYVRHWPHSLLEGEVMSFQCLFLVIGASDVTMSAVLTNHNTVYMLFQRSTAFFYMLAEP